ncbi:MAG: DUF2961 domain-containing protein, partial [Bacteroidia bacterium]|nr:DUF2961 domain-containing protein [Bacteroidia bacterium]
MTDKAFYNIVNYRAYEKGANVKTFTLKQFAKAAPLIALTAKTLVERPSPLTSSAITKTIHLKSNDIQEFSLPDGSKAIRELTIRIDPKSGLQALRSTILELTFDGVRTVWCPVGDFFCRGDKINPFHTWNRSVLPDGTMI